MDRSGRYIALGFTASVIALLAGVTIGLTAKRKRMATPLPDPIPPVADGVVIFDGAQGMDDNAYQAWGQAHPQGFVVNSYRIPYAPYLQLHRATCGHISNFGVHAPGAFTERDFIKICSDTLDPLREWVRQHGRPDGSFTGCCPCISGLSSPI